MISENFEKLFQAAKDVRDNAHVPYSKFKVGACISYRGQFNYCGVQC
jgi:cytidine deaminase